MGTLSLKLLIDTRAQPQRVLFAEAGKSVVTFLESLLSLPVSSIVVLLSHESMVGSIGNVHSSIERMKKGFVAPAEDLDRLMIPGVATPRDDPNELLSPEPPKSKGVFYRCSRYDRCYMYMTDVRDTPCSVCKGTMSTPVLYYAGPEGAQAKANAEPVDYGTYTITDDLHITPMSAISSISLLNALKVRDIGGLQEKTVELGLDEGLKILRASLESKTVLTDTFITKNPVVRRNARS